MPGDPPRQRGPQKTGQTVTIPLHKQVKAILEKRNGFPRAISDQKFNEHVKDVCEEVGFKEKVQGSKINKKTKRKEEGLYHKYELVTSHICRRSFATNNYGTVPNQTLMAICGWASEEQMLDYIKKTNREHAETLKKVWDNKYKNVI